jgi:hypothetical protein
MRTAMPPGQTFSAGTATWDRTEGVTELLERADQALYEDKLGGGARPPSRSSPGS